MLAALAFAAMAARASAHPGALDADGGHWDKATNTYHWHQDAEGKDFNTPVDGGKDHQMGQKAPVKAKEWNKEHKKPSKKPAKKGAAKAAKRKPKRINQPIVNQESAANAEKAAAAQAKANQK